MAFEGVLFTRFFIAKNSDCGCLRQLEECQYVKRLLLQNDRRETNVTSALPMRSLPALRTVLGDWGLPLNKRFALSGTGKHCLPLAKTIANTTVLVYLECHE